MATKIVGLDLGTHTVKVCELVTNFRNFELVGFGHEPLETTEEAPDFEVLAAAARRLLERRGLLNETLMCALPPGMAATTSLDLPFDQPKKIEAVLPMQLDDLLPVPVDDVVYDYQVTERREDGGAKVLVAYVRRDRFAELLTALEAAGIDPKVVGIGPLTTFNLYDHAIGAESNTPVAMLDLGHGHSELSVYDRGEPRIVRDIAGGGRDVTRALAAAFHVELDQAERGKLQEGFVAPDGFVPQDVDPATGASRQKLVADACRGALRGLVRGVRRSLVAHEMEAGRAVERIYLTGGGSLLRGLPEYLEHELKIPIIPLDPLQASFNKLPAGGEKVRPFIAKSMALSLRAFTRTHQSQVNFRKGDFAYTGDFGFLQGRIITLAVAALLMIMLGSLVALTKKQQLEAEYAAIRARAAALSVPILGYEDDDVQLLYDTVVVTDRRKQASIPDYDALQMLAQISERIPFAPELVVDIDSLDIDVENKRMQLSGKTGSGGDVERIVEALRATDCFKGEINKERVEKSVDDRTKFRLSATATCI